VGVFWGSQVLLIVLGHVIAVVAAHRVALARTETTGQARRMHAPLVVLMIGYTVLSLWIVSRPIATG
jgi:ABC-type amino acid transport system permease subunit